MHQSPTTAKTYEFKMDIFLAYLLYKRQQQSHGPDYIETAIAIMVLIAGLAKMAALCKGRP